MVAMGMAKQHEAADNRKERQGYDPGGMGEPTESPEKFDHSHS